ncbi:hypothetical protein CLTEP_04210 [Clostridium tepidiprofundi DSM 19306]|uniref:TIGR04086 family membrane protein n=1 Tax=Clostridium tepidiprofundi DSM 19306 TaxID=1121338 RepID=A0A151B8Q6_9CLOT|nr:TIGR04086 family membrane protein [Clostridium tepidiprofundi]KYH36027.1 hypothetical protein CLTEP_04210 [Clostridium tepidiprofundi DSM 19306]
MSKNIKFSCISEGVIRGIILTVIALLIYSAITMIFPDNVKVKAIFLMIITCISVLYGAAFAAKKAGRKGWLTGMLVALLYCFVIYIVSVIAGRGFIIGTKDILRILIALMVGALSGMLGINL